jgi:hypothetical protein
MGIALPAPFSSPPAGHRAPLAQQPENGGGGVGGGGIGGGGMGGSIPEHLQVLKRLSAASTSPNNVPRPRVRTTVDDLAEKISATNFVLAGMLLQVRQRDLQGRGHCRICSH